MLLAVCPSLTPRHPQTETGEARAPDSGQPECLPSQTLCGRAGRKPRGKGSSLAPRPVSSHSPMVIPTRAPGARTVGLSPLQAGASSLRIQLCTRSPTSGQPSPPAGILGSTQAWAGSSCRHSRVPPPLLRTDHTHKHTRRKQTSLRGGQGAGGRRGWG